MCCSPSSQIQARRQLKVGGGRIVQCMVCGSVGVEFGTCYLTFEGRDFFAFIRWFHDFVRREPPGARSDGRVYLRLPRSEMLLALTPFELRSLAAILAEAKSWIESATSTPSLQVAEGLVN
ncbi:MAG: hypothetical protein AAGN66_17695 [Acidobacteriota bacterium]